MQHRHRKALDAAEHDDGNDQSKAGEAGEAGEAVEAVEREIAVLGWRVAVTKNGTKNLNKLVFEGRTQRWPSDTKRVVDLVASIGPQEQLSYRLLSAVAHAELHGLARNLAPAPHRDRGRTRLRRGSGRGATPP